MLSDVRKISPTELGGYLEGRGWKRVEGARRPIAVFRHPDDELEEIVLPLDPAFADFDQRMADALEAISQRERRPVSALISDLLELQADVLRFQQVGPGLEDGHIPLSDGVSLLSACKRAIEATAHLVLDPRPFHPRLGRSEAEQLLARCRMSTEPGSFVVRITCPLDAVPELDEGDLESSVPSEPFSRRVTRTLMTSSAAVVSVIDKDRVEDWLKEEQPGISANLCEALVNMQPPGDGVSMIISAGWSPELAPPADLPGRICLRPEHFTVLERIARRLRPKSVGSPSKLWVGHVEALHGQPDEQGRMCGEIVLRLQGEEEELLKAKALLNADDYVVACDAHRDSHFVRLFGVLQRGQRIHRLVEVREFLDLSAGMPQAC